LKNEWQCIDEIPALAKFEAADPVDAIYGGSNKELGGIGYPELHNHSLE
jgi:hypothetical protein